PLGNTLGRTYGVQGLRGEEVTKRTVDVSIPVGPIHPCFKEPARVKCETKGEFVLSAEVELGYMKKGIERIMRGRPWQEVMFLAERVCGICSVIHNMVFIEALEQISAIFVPERQPFSVLSSTSWTGCRAISLPIFRTAIPSSMKPWECISWMSASM